MVIITAREGRALAGGRGNLRVAKTPPLQSGVGGDAIATRIAILVPSTATRRP